MQMSLEAITMLMRFHHRSCCSGIRGIFHPYLENNCVLKIGDTLFPVFTVELVFTLSTTSWNLVRAGQEKASLTLLSCSWSSRLQWFVLPLFCSIFSTSSVSWLLVNHQQAPFINITIKLVLLPSKHHKHPACWRMFSPKKTQMSVIVYTSSCYIKHSPNFIFPRSAVKQDKTCSGFFRTGAASERSGAKPVARLLEVCSLCAKGRQVGR